MKNIKPKNKGDTKVYEESPKLVGKITVTIDPNLL